MVDIRLISIISGQPISGVQQPGSAQAVGGQAASILPSLPTGSVLSGFIINRDTQGNPILRTENGDFAFKTNFFLKIGSEVVIRIENHAGTTQAHLLTVNGKPPEIAVTQSPLDDVPDVVDTRAQPANTQRPPAQTAQGVTTPAAARVSSVITVNATLLSTPPAAPGNVPPLTAGTEFVLKVVTLAAPSPPTPQQPAALATTTAQAAPPPANPSAAAPQASAPAYAAYTRNVQPPVTTAPASQTPVVQGQPAVSPTVQAPLAPTPATPQAQLTQHTTTAAAPLTPGAPTPATPVSPRETIVTTFNTPANTPTVTQPVAAPPAPPASQASAPQPGQQLAASVIGSEPTGEAVLQTPLGLVRLGPGTALPPGSKVTFEIVTITPPAADTAATKTTEPTPLTQLAKQWATLQQIFTLLSSRPLDANTVSPTATPWLLSSSIPSGKEALPPQAISAGLMLFIAALKGGDFRNWLGKSNAQWLETEGHGDLVKKAEGEFVSMARQFAGAQPGHWQALFVPIAHGGELHQVRLFTKRDRRQKNNMTRREENTRFVIEVGLTQMGEMQMDGFVRRKEQKLDFDLVIRSLAPLPGDVQKDIFAIYNGIGEITGYSGSLSFQAVQEFPVNPMEEVANQHISNLMA